METPDMTTDTARATLADRLMAEADIEQRNGLTFRPNSVGRNVYLRTETLLREAATELTTLTARVEAAEGERDRLRRLLTDWHAQETARGARKGQAPGHCHDIPGIWDPDNGKLAGKPCARCALWNDISDAAIDAGGSAG